jgi:MSHA biogenesis protein MshN
MSAINSMLTELNRRGIVVPPTEADAGGLPDGVVPIPKARAVWQSPLLASVLVIALVAGLYFGLDSLSVAPALPVAVAPAPPASPDLASAVTEPASSASAEDSQAAGETAAGVATTAAPPASALAALPLPPAVRASPQPSVPRAVAPLVNATAVPPAAVPLASVGTLRMASELTMPTITIRPTQPAPQLAPAPAPEPVIQIKPSERSERGDRGGMRSNTGSSASASAQDKAEQEYRRGMALVQRGRMAEAMELLQAALTLDPAHEGARQARVAYLVESKRLDEAIVALREGLDLHGARHADAMLLARLLVERNDIPNALATLQRHAIGAEENAEYRGFRAALLQRVGRHTEAIAEYRQALRLSVSNAVWWVGLGMSFDATDRAKEAGDAFRQARQIGRLSADMNSYIEQRLRHLP